MRQTALCQIHTPVFSLYSLHCLVLHIQSTASKLPAGAWKRVNATNHDDCASKGLPIRERFTNSCWGYTHLLILYERIKLLGLGRLEKREESQPTYYLCTNVCSALQPSKQTTCLYCVSLQNVTEVIHIQTVLP